MKKFTRTIATLAAAAALVIAPAVAAQASDPGPARNCQSFTSVPVPISMSGSVNGRGVAAWFWVKCTTPGSIAYRTGVADLDGQTLDWMFKQTVVNQAYAGTTWTRITGWNVPCQAKDGNGVEQIVGVIAVNQGGWTYTSGNVATFQC